MTHRSRKSLRSSSSSIHLLRLSWILLSRKRLRSSGVGNSPIRSMVERRKKFHRRKFPLAADGGYSNSQTLTRRCSLQVFGLETRTAYQGVRQPLHPRITGQREQHYAVPGPVPSTRPFSVTVAAASCVLLKKTAQCVMSRDEPSLNFGSNFDGLLQSFCSIKYLARRDTSMPPVLEYTSGSATAP